jgi:hypothetical protein
MYTLFDEDGILKHVPTLGADPSDLRNYHWVPSDKSI